MINTKFIGKKVLITTDRWFIGPDGQDHAAVWGTLNRIWTDKDLDFKAATGMANWVYEIGDVIIMGCQVKYFCLCEIQPNPDQNCWSLKDGLPVEYQSKGKILITK